jgi:hypothetical protein
MASSDAVPLEDEPDYARACQLIQPGLFFGPLGAAQDESHLATLGITHVVTVMGGPSNLFPGRCTYLHLAVEDSQAEASGLAMKAALPGAMEFIGGLNTGFYEHTYLVRLRPARHGRRVAFIRAIMTRASNQHTPPIV